MELFYIRKILSNIDKFDVLWFAMETLSLFLMGDIGLFYQQLKTEKKAYKMPASMPVQQSPIVS